MLDTSTLRSLRACARSTAIAGGLALGLTAVARAESSDSLDIDWVATETCPTAATVRAEVARLLGPTSATPNEHVSVRAEPTRLPNGRWHTDVVTARGSRVGRRALDADSCQALADAVVIMTALMLDPSTVGPPTDAPLTTGAAPSATSAPRPSNPVRLPAAPLPISSNENAAELAPNESTDHAAMSWLASLGGASTIGMLASSDWAIRGELGVVVGRVRTALSVLGSAPAHAAPNGGSGGDFHWVAASGTACLRVFGEVWQLSPCVGTELDWATGTGTGTANEPVSAYPGSAFWWSVEAGGLLEWQISRHLAVPVRIDAIVPLARPAFVLTGTDGTTLVSQPGYVTGRVSLALAVRFP